MQERPKMGFGVQIWTVFCPDHALMDEEE